MSNTKTVQLFRDSLVKGQINSLLLRKIIFFFVQYCLLNVIIKYRKCTVVTDMLHSFDKE